MKKLALILLTSISAVNCTKVNNTENLLGKVDSLEIKNDSLIETLNREKTELNYWYDPEYDGVKFIEKGISKPIEFIKNSLRKKTELIPLKAVLGGTMTFGNIQLLGSEWLIADYNDGHIEGRAIYSYELNDNGMLKFKMIKSIKLE